ncbi:hypothetical protein ACIBQX_11635 [Nonomuraea sp. NPDC049714]|uniref:hypothetical protein n=1 Tax=Nonomuraea sp. NPDC049714 TaxID=3364357 RepID=UPI0037973CC1
MARIRSIKPDFFTSEKIASLPMSARLTFIGLWTHADDNGVAADNVRLIAAAIWPLEDDPLEALVRTREDLRRLSEAGLIVRYEAAGRALLFITSWDEHQKVSHPGKPRYVRPTPDEIDDAFAMAYMLSCDDEDESDVVVPLSGESRESGGNVPETFGPEQGAGSREQGNNPPTPQRGKRGSRRVGDDDPGFARFWETYPRKVGKGHAKKAWAKAMDDNVDPEEIIAGAERFRMDPTRSRDPQFIAHPSTWLNGERWKDQPLTHAETHRPANVGMFWEN